MKQKQVQNVKIVIGETKKRRAPRRAAPRRPPGGGAPPPPPPPGGGPLRPPPQAGAPSYLPFPQMFPPRGGPAVESQSSLQQLIRPLEQTLARLQGPQQQQRPALEAADIMRYVGRIVSPLYEQIEMLQQPPPPRVSSSSSSTEMGPVIQEQREIEVQTDFSVPDHTAQIQLVGPPSPLIRAVEPPLIDAVVEPIERKYEEVPIEDEVQIEEEGPYTVQDIQNLQRRGQVNRQFLDRFQVSKITPSSRGMTLLKIGQALGIDFPADFRKYPRPGKSQVVNYILQSLENPQL